MDGHLEVARRSHVSTDPQTIRDLEHQFDDVPPVGGNLLRRFADWLEPTAGTVSTSGAVMRAVVCTLLCVVVTLAIVGALTGVVMAVGRIASLR